MEVNRKTHRRRATQTQSQIASETGRTNYNLCWDGDQGYYRGRDLEGDRGKGGDSGAALGLALGDGGQSPGWSTSIPVLG